MSRKSKKKKRSRRKNTEKGPRARCERVKSLSDDKFKTEVLSFVKEQGYFQQFSSTEQDEYIDRVSDHFNFSSVWFQWNYRLCLGNDYFIDERIVGYRASASESISKLELLFIALTPFIAIALLEVAKHWMYVWSVIEVGLNILPFKHLTTLMAVFGSILVGLDILFTQQRLSLWDKRLNKIIRNYEKSWVQSIKVSLTVHQRHNIDMMDWAVIPVWHIALYMYAFRMSDFPSANFCALMIFFGSYSILLSPNSSFKLSGLFLVALGIVLVKKDDNYRFFWDENYKVFVWVYSYYIILGTILQFYKYRPNLRKLSYYVLMFAGSPYLILKTIYRIVPFALLLPVHGIVRVSMLVKPTSVFRLVGLIIIVSAYLVEKYFGQ